MRGSGEGVEEWVREMRIGEGQQDDTHASDSARDRDFEFSGRHLLASYSGCDAAALADVERLSAAMHAAIKASGATLLMRSFSTVTATPAHTLPLPSMSFPNLIYWVAAIAWDAIAIAATPRSVLFMDVSIA